MRTLRLLLIGMALVITTTAVAQQPDPERERRRDRRERRQPEPGSDAGSAGAPVQRHEDPSEAPPPPQAESSAPRAGFVWIPGHHMWRGKWIWVPGRYDRERPGKKWRAGRWEKVGAKFKWTGGAWEDDATTPATGGDYPKDAPPAPQAETAAPRPGSVWIAGRWEWKAGKYAWVAGRYEKERPGKKWREGRWDKDGDRYKFSDGDWVDAAATPAEDPRRPRKEWKLERPMVGSFWPPKGKVGARVVIRGKNLPPETQVLWAGAPIAAAKVTPDRITFNVPAGAASGAISLKVGRRELPVGTFEVADVDAEAAAKKAEEEAKKAAEAAAAARMKAFADAAARRAAIQKEIDERAANRERRRDERIAAMRAKWDREFLADAETRDELVLHAYRVAHLARLREVAELNGNQGALVRIELATKREDTRHEDRMTSLKAAFKGGKP